MTLRDRLLDGTFGFCGVEGDGTAGGGTSTPSPVLPGNDATHTPIAATEPDFDSKFEEMFRFDPFAKGAEGDTPATSQAAPQTAAPVSPAPVTPAVAPATPDPSAPPTAKSEPSATSADALAAAAHALQTATANLNKPAPAAAETPPDDPLLNYMYEVPPAVAQALTSDDPNIRVRATNAMHAVFARTVHQRVRQDVAQMIKTELPKLVTNMLSEHNYRTQIRNDLYGQFPELENETIAPVIQNIAAKVMSQPGFNKWNKATAAKIAEEVFALMPGLRKTIQAAQPQQPNPQPVVPQQPPALITNGSRPGASANGAIEDIAATIFGGYGTVN